MAGTKTEPLPWPLFLDAKPLHPASYCLHAVKIKGYLFIFAYGKRSREKIRAAF